MTHEAGPLFRRGWTATRDSTIPNGGSKSASPALMSKFRYRIEEHREGEKNKVPVNKLEAIVYIASEKQNDPLQAELNWAQPV